MVHVKVFESYPAPVTHLDTDEPSVREAIGTVMLRFNRNTHKGNVHVQINGKDALYDPWFMVFYSWHGTGWAQLRNPHYYFTH